MGCPYFIDYARECVEDIRALPEETITLCDSDSYTQCPFYLYEYPTACCGDASVRVLN